MHWQRSIFHSKKMASDHYASDDGTYGNNYYDTFSNYCKIRLLNTVLGYVLPMIVNPFNIFLFRQVFVNLPDDVYEAAQLDYCSPVKYFYQWCFQCQRV